MGDWNLGSVATELHNLIDNIPTAISGGTLLDLVDRNRQFIESYTNLDVGSTGIVLKWQGPLIDLSMSELLSVMNTVGADVSSIRLGDFSESKGGQSNVLVSSQDFRMRGLSKLNAIGTRVRFYKALG